MSLQVVQTQDEAKAREKFRISLARLTKQYEDAEDPEKLAQMANIPPHLLNRH